MHVRQRVDSINQACMSDFLLRVAEAADIDIETAKRAVGFIFAFMRHTGSGSSDVAEMIEGTPGATEALAAAGDGEISFYGADLMALGAKLMALGLDIAQIRIVSEELAAFCAQHVGEPTVVRAVASVPAFRYLKPSVATAS